MAVRESVSPNGAARRAWFVAACLVVLFVAALFLRAYWNLEAANPSEGEFVLSGGSDPYYHKRAVDAILADGDGDGQPDFKHHLSDPLLNYPRGSENPNPPLYEWSIAVGAFFLKSFSGGDLAESAWKATIWSPSIFGALTVFPVYFIGAALFSRRAGLIAALLWTVSTSAVDAGGAGLADHDSAVLFFVSLSILFYVQMIRSFRGDGNWVARWSDGSAVGPGLSRMFRERGVGFAYALLAAVSIAAVALTWKGFNYVLGIIFLYAIVQMIVDHWRNRDSTGLFLGTFVAMLLGVILALPYYSTANVGNFLQPTWFMLAAFLIAGLVLVPTRDLPTILVLPIAGVVGIVLAIAAFFVFPDVAQSLLFATVYFKQTRLYQTIAEAHPADFATIAFGVGPLPFFLALFGWLILLFRIHATGVSAWTRIGIGAAIFALGAIVDALLGLAGNATVDAIGFVILGLAGLAGISIILGGEAPGARLWGFAILWAAIAVFMAQSAVRFLINAIPVFCVLAGFGTDWVLTWLDFGSIRKSLAANRGNFWGGFRRGLRPLHVISVILIALLFVLPATMLAADAALPPEAEDKLARDTESDFVRSFFTERMGAYGGGFGQVKPWIPALEFLKEHDANTTSSADRPAFLAWWDYGHWAIAIGEHPAVADNFQNGYEFAANFILSQDETHGIQLLASRLAEDPKADLEKALVDAGSANAQADAAQIRSWQKVNLTKDQSVALLTSLETQTGKSIRYFATDIRMLPYDNPQTQNIDAGSIYYAPVTLKGDKPDAYVTTEVNLGTSVPGHPDGYVTVEQYEELVRSSPTRQYQAVSERLAYRDAFFNSAYWRHYVGAPIQQSGAEPIQGGDVETSLNNPTPAGGLDHWRVVYVGAVTRLYRGGDPAELSSYVYYPEIVVTEFYRGAIVEGTVTEDGNPVAGATVVAFDDAGRLLAERYGSGIADASQFNVGHNVTTTDAQGKFRIVAPFALPGGNVTLMAQRAGVRVGTAILDITREDAQAQRTFSGVEITVERGSVAGMAFNDANGDSRFDPRNDTPAANVGITIGGQSATTDASGNYTIPNVPAGPQTVTTDASGLEVGQASSRVTVQPGSTPTPHNVGLVPHPSELTGRLVAPVNGTDTGTPFTTMTFTADPSVAGNTARTKSGVFTDSSGNFTAELAPGTYKVTATYTAPGGGTKFALDETLVVESGVDIADREFRMTETA